MGVSLRFSLLLPYPCATKGCLSVPGGLCSFSPCGMTVAGLGVDAGGGAGAFRGCEVETDGVETG